MSVLKLTKNVKGEIVEAFIDDKALTGIVSVSQVLDRGSLKATIVAIFDSVETTEAPPVPPEPAPVLTAVFAAGSVVGATKATISGALGAGNSFAYKLGTVAEVTPKIGAAISGTTVYTSGTDITGADVATKKYIALYELAADNKAVKFLAHTIVAGEIKTV